MGYGGYMKKLLLILTLALAGSQLGAMNDDSDGIDPEDTPRRWIYESEEMPPVQEAPARPVNYEAFEAAINGLNTEMVKLKAQNPKLSELSAVSIQAENQSRLKSLMAWLANHQKTTILVALIGCYLGSYGYDCLANPLPGACLALNNGCQTCGDYPILGSVCPKLMELCAGYLPVAAPQLSGWFSWK